jgi:hypothetical protein
MMKAVRKYDPVEYAVAFLICAVGCLVLAWAYHAAFGW